MVYANRRGDDPLQLQSSAVDQNDPMVIFEDSNRSRRWPR